MALQLEKISVKELRHYIMLGFMDDPDLISKYHISPGTIEHCVDFNFDRIKDAENNGGEFFKISNEGVEIGFVLAVKNPNMVLSFGINIHHRNKNTLLSWLAAMKKFYEEQTYIVALWPRNIRAIMFFLKNGFMFSITDEMVMLWQ